MVTACARGRNRDAQQKDNSTSGLEDDGTCKIFGCTDTTADNYNPFATDDDASCVPLCRNGRVHLSDAENFNPDAL